MKMLPIVPLLLAITGCGNLHRYEGPDASLISRLCGLTPAPAQDGKLYISEAGITAVDGNLPGTGVSCNGNATHRINPKAKKITFFVLYQEPGERYAYFAYPQIDVTLRAHTRYFVETAFDGTTVKLQLIESQTGMQMAQTQTTDVKRQSTANAALAALPLLMK